VTDDRIVLLNEDKIDNAVRVVSLMEKSPEFEPGSVYGITGGKFTHQDGSWEATIDALTCRATRPRDIQKSGVEKRYRTD
jgi:hypothetical protein